MHPFFAGRRPRLFAHRGASGDAPENTLIAFVLGLAQGAHYLETDARLTRDGVAVLIHDADVDRTTDGSGPVAKLAAAELARLDAGFRFQREGQPGFPYRGRGLRVPTLEELLGAQPEARVNLEVKGSDPAAADAIVAVLRSAAATSRVLLAAAEEPVFARLVELDSGAALGSSVRDVVELIRASVEGRLGSFEPRGHALQIPPFFMGRPLATPQLVAAAHRVGLEVHVWTVDEPAEAARLLAMGVDGCMTDFPARLLPLWP